MSSSREVESLLSESDPEKRRLAVGRITELLPALRVPAVLAALGDTDWRVRKEAIGLTAELGPEPDLLSALAEVFEPGDNVGLRNAAVEALGGFGLFAVETLGPRMSRLDPDGKKLAIEALGRSAEPAALDVLSPLVYDSDPNVRVAALEAVGSVGATRLEEARELLSARLDGNRPLETLAALESLSCIGASISFERLEHWLGDALLGRSALSLAAHSADPRAAAPLVRALLEAGSTDSVATLADFVAASESTRRAALLELDSRGELARGALLAWLEPGVSDIEGTRAALSVVGALGVSEGATPAVGFLSDARCYAEADQALFLLGELAAPALLSGARSPDTETAAACLDLIGRLPAESVSPEARRVLNAALGSPMPDVVRAALGALTRVGDADCLRELTRLLVDASLVSLVEPALGAISLRYPADAQPLIRSGSSVGPSAHAAALIISALSSRSRLGGVDEHELAAFLTRLLMSTSHAERRAALAALAELNAAEALDAVTFALSDEEESVRVEAVRTLGKLRAQDQNQVGVPALLEVVAEPRDPVVLLAALRALGESSDPRAISVLGPLVRALDARIAATAVEALSRHADPRRVSSLFDGLLHPEPEVVKASMLAIAAEPDARVVVHLGACLDQPAWDVRRLAADLLGRAPSDASAALLRARLSVEQDPMVKDALTRALESSGQRRSRPPRRPQ